MTSILVALSSFAVILLVMAVFTDDKMVLAGGVILSGFFLGINNTLVTETVMKAAPVERGTASAAYSFVRFGGGAIAPWLAGVLGEEVSVHLPFYVGAGAVALAVALLAGGRALLAHVDDEEAPDAAGTDERELAQAVTPVDS